MFPCWLALGFQLTDDIGKNKRMSSYERRKDLKGQKKESSRWKCLRKNWIWFLKNMWIKIEETSELLIDVSSVGGRLEWNLYTYFTFPNLPSFQLFSKRSRQFCQLVQLRFSESSLCIRSLTLAVLTTRGFLLSGSAYFFFSLKSLLFLLLMCTSFNF